MRLVAQLLLSHAVRPGALGLICAHFFLPVLVVIIVKVITVKTNAMKSYPYLPPPSSLLIYYAESTVTGPLQALYSLSMATFKSFSLFLPCQKCGYGI